MKLYDKKTNTIHFVHTVTQIDFDDQGGATLTSEFSKMEHIFHISDNKLMDSKPNVGDCVYRDHVNNGEIIWCSIDDLSKIFILPS